MIETEKAAQALSEFAEGPAKQAADAVSEHFERAGRRMATALERAAISGEFSIRDMANAIANDLAALAIQELVVGPLETFFSEMGQGGGGQSGGANPVNIVMNVSGVSDASGFQKSQGQISASLARAVAHGQKFS